MTVSQTHINQALANKSGNLRPLPSLPNKPLLRVVEPQGQIEVHTAAHSGSFPVVLSEALRSAGLGSQVLIAQLLKGGVNQGASKGINLCGRLQWLRPNLPFYLGQDKLVDNQLSEQFLKAQNAVEEVWQFCKQSLLKGNVQKLVLDEIGLAVKLGFIKDTDLIQTLESRPGSIDVVLTGPFIPTEVIAMADQVTELRCCK